MKNSFFTQKHGDKTAVTRLRALLFVGPPGSGKGTQGRALADLPQFVHCSCGDIFRSIDIGSKLGGKFLEYSRAGRLMPDAETVELWLAHISRITSEGLFKPDSNYLLLDGIPRNPRQAELMDSFIEVTRVFNLWCPTRQPLIDRMRKRALKENRPDDADELVINRRLDVYETESQPLLKYYPSKIVHTIDATLPPHVVLNEILAGILTCESSGNPLHNPLVQQQAEARLW